MLTENNRDKGGAAAKRHHTKGQAARPVEGDGGVGGDHGAAAQAPAKKDLERKVQDLQAEVARLGAELQEARDKYLRALADFDNYRKRVAREADERTRCANEDLIRRMLEVVDNMERAIGASSSSADAEGLRKGLELTYSQLTGLLAGEGLCPIKCLGEKFDPNYHDAVMALEQEGAESDSVVEEIQKGYTLGQKVIRPSKVVVSK